MIFFSSFELYGIKRHEKSLLRAERLKENVFEFFFAEILLEICLFLLLEESLENIEKIFLHGLWGKILKIRNLGNLAQIQTIMNPEGALIFGVFESRFEDNFQCVIPDS